jgi:hypothetical protein
MLEQLRQQNLLRAQLRQQQKLSVASSFIAFHS